MDVIFGWPDAYRSHHLEPESPAENSLWFVFRAGHLLLARNARGELALPAHSPHTRTVGPAPYHYLGMFSESHAYAVEIPSDEEAPAGYEWLHMRRAHGQIEPAHYALAGRALQIMEWERTHRFCGSCGTEMRRRATERARECPACGAVSYPKVTPVVMALVKRGRRILLARGPHFAPGVVSVLAGFVEPGETLEQCIRREVLEEVGLHATNIRYIASQPWPFPHSLMVGFFADAPEGEIRIDPTEIVEAGWYDIDNLPQLPGRMSLARVLIEAAIREDRTGSPFQT